MQKLYKAAVEDWIAAIRQEEALASVNHDVADVDKWEAAHSGRKTSAITYWLPRSDTKMLFARNSLAFNVCAINHLTSEYMLYGNVTVAMARLTLSCGQSVTGPGAAPGLAMLVPWPGRFRICAPAAFDTRTTPSTRSTPSA